MKKNIFKLLLLSLFLFQKLFASIILVPEDYASIQEAINVSVNGDTILVNEGTYYENLNFNGKNIFLTSHFLLDNNLNHIDLTIINGSNPVHADTASCVLIVSGEDSTAILQGFTLTGGKGTVWDDEHNPGSYYREGGGILIQYSSPTIRNNKIIHNTANNATGVTSAGGGAIRAGDSKPYIYNNIIAFNDALYGGGIVLNYSASVIRNNIIWNNTGGDDYGGSGIWMVGTGEENSIIENNTIVGNIAKRNGGGFYILQSFPEIKNNIIFGNFGYILHQIYPASGTNITFSAIQDGYDGEGNISDYPLFESSHFYLNSESECIDAGHPDYDYSDIEDEMQLGNALWPSLGTTINDIGAYGGPMAQELPVISKRIIYARDTIVDFGYVYFGDTASMEIDVYNLGSIPLNITECVFNPVSDNSISFDLNIEGVLDPIQKDILKFKWIPERIDTLAGEILIYHDSEDQVNPLQIHFSGIAREPISVNQHKTISNYIEIYPNPLKDNLLNIRFQNPNTTLQRLEIYDILGNKIESQLILQATNNENITIQLNNIIESGIYVLHIISKNKISINKKLIIK